VVESNESKKCAVCHQTKPAQYFPKITRSTGLAQAPICLLCQAALEQGDSGDEGGSGGKQNQHSKDAKHQQRAIELENILQKSLDNLAIKKQSRSFFQISQEREVERKTQITQREWLDQKEQESKTLQEKDEPNPEASLGTQVKRKGIVHLFAVTRALALNRIAAYNKEAAAQKNFSLFSKTHEKQSTTKLAQQIDLKNDKTNTTEQAADVVENEETAVITDKKTLSTDSLTLFSHSNTTKPTAENTEKLANAIKEGQKIFR
jgi:hypothetical protein